MKHGSVLLAALATLAACTPTQQPGAPAPAPRPGAAPAAAPATPTSTPTPGAPGGPGGPAGQGGGQGGQPGGGPGGGGPGGGGQPTQPRPYRSVITERAVTQNGLLKVHRVGEQLFFEIPARVLNKEMLLISRNVESTLQSPSGFFGGGSRNIVQWERQGNRVVLRAKDFDLMADSTSAIWNVVKGFRKGAVLASYNVAAYGPDSAAVVDVSDLFLSNIPELGPIAGIQRNKSWVEQTWAFDDNVDVEVTQSGAGAAAAPPGAPAGFGGGAQRSQTVRVHFSMLKLPDQPMMPRWEDERVGFISSSWYDMSRPVHRAEAMRFIHRFKLVKKDPNAAVSDPVEPIIYWIDPATPDWLKPWIVSGVNKWQEAFRKAGFSNAIFGRVAPTPAEDPNFSMYDARRSVIYWNPSTVANATGGQIVDPRSGQILKGEVNMYHNIMELQKNWYFIQVSPLDARAQRLPLPDSLMGRLVEYVVTHEIGHSIGFPHNMKSSAQYPVDSIRSRTFLERMHGHVATLMDYSRFNYVAQPEDSIPPHLLIPQVGPYDEFAVHWGYAPIPSARTPDEEKPTLDQWAREQDRFPWLRFSTSDAEGDPEDQTEAVGDADAVRATTLGMKNLERVVGSLIRVAEKPGENYDELEMLYGEAVSQWGRYMGHVGSIIGGAYTQERYGTGPRFRPLERARQQEAVRYLNQTAFQVPTMFLDPAILRRIENAGVVERVRQRQTAVVNSLLSQARLNRLVEFEALAANPREAYTLSDLMTDLRTGIYSELAAPTVRVNAYRRNLQRAFLAAADARLNPPAAAAAPAGLPAGFPGAAPANPAFSDVRAAMRATLQDIDAAAAAALPKAGDGMTRIHLRDLRTEIRRILDDED
ncbi:MAG: zinc-dependent metalloprotease [Gemmatimonadaceae bacterium]|nr:zinc-dependent metalloprotease [Gemmatimonadaceae bacterium]